MSSKKQTKKSLEPICNASSKGLNAEDAKELEKLHGHGREIPTKRQKKNAPLVLEMVQRFPGQKHSSFLMTISLPNCIPLKVLVEDFTYFWRTQVDIEINGKVSTVA